MEPGNGGTWFKKKNPNKAKLKSLKKIPEFILCWPITLCHRACPRLWLIHPMTRDPPLDAGNPSGLNLYRSCSCCHNLYEFTCTLVLEDSSLEVIHHLRLIQSFFLLCHIDPWALRGGGVMRTECIKVSHSLDVVVQLKFYPCWLTCLALEDRLSSRGEK